MKPPDELFIPLKPGRNGTEKRKPLVCGRMTAIIIWIRGETGRRREETTNLG